MRQLFFINILVFFISIGCTNANKVKNAKKSVRAHTENHRFNSKNFRSKGLLKSLATIFAIGSIIKPAQGSVIDSNNNSTISFNSNMNFSNETGSHILAGDKGYENDFNINNKINNRSISIDDLYNEDKGSIDPVKGDFKTNNKIVRKRRRLQNDNKQYGWTTTKEPYWTTRKSSSWDSDKSYQDNVWYKNTPEWWTGKGGWSDKNCNEYTEKAVKIIVKEYWKTNDCYNQDEDSCRSHEYDDNDDYDSSSYQSSHTDKIDHNNEYDSSWNKDYDTSSSWNKNQDQDTSSYYYKDKCTNVCPTIFPEQPKWPTEQPKWPTEQPKWPTEQPKWPTKKPTKDPLEWGKTHGPTNWPTNRPTKSPTNWPTKWPTEEPTEKPTEEPTEEPTEWPTKSPTKSPTKGPTLSWPTPQPVGWPTPQPVGWPTERPSWPTPSPVKWPTKWPSEKSDYPEYEGVDEVTISVVCGDDNIDEVCDKACNPTPPPTKWPTPNPVWPTKNPTFPPLKSWETQWPTEWPTNKPTQWPTKWPTKWPTEWPTEWPTNKPTRWPTKWPTKWPTNKPTKWGEESAEEWPTKSPTNKPTYYPTQSPTTLVKFEEQCLPYDCLVDFCTMRYKVCAGRKDDDSVAFLGWLIPVAIVAICLCIIICCCWRRYKNNRPYVNVKIVESKEGNYNIELNNDRLDGVIHDATGL